MRDPIDRSAFLSIAALFYCGLLSGAFLFGWLSGVDPFRHFVADWTAVAWGIAGTVPIFLFFLAAYRIPLRPFREIRRFLVEMLGPLLASCRWYDLICLALLAGVCEELFFRGWLQVWLEGWGPYVGLIGSNIVFGLAHCITALYAIVAGTIGIYLGLLFDASGERNLLVPIITHALYDYLGFLVVLRTWRSRHDARLRPPGPESPSD